MAERYLLWPKNGCERGRDNNEREHRQRAFIRRRLSTGERAKQERGDGATENASPGSTHEHALVDAGGSEDGTYKYSCCHWREQTSPVLAVFDFESKPGPERQQPDDGEDERERERVDVLADERGHKRGKGG
jgi:hypothetical protein